MKFSKREAVLLVILLIIALGFVEYQLVFVPGMVRYELLAEKDQKIQEQVDDTNRLINSIPAIKIKKEKALSEIALVSNPFFDRLNTDSLLWNAHDILTKSGLTLNSYTITKLGVSPIVGEQSTVGSLTYKLKTLADEYNNAAKKTDTASTTPTTAPSNSTPSSGTKDNSGEIEDFSILIDFTGNYEQIRQFLISLESLKKTIVVSDLTMSSTGSQGVVNGHIKVRYFGIQKINSVSDPINSWTQPSYTAGSGNPFK